MPTEFQVRVYALTRKIPQGRVATYADLARAMGTGAVRAVGTALARNPAIPATPCHRVVRSNGSIGQYACGSAKKGALLQQEGVAVVNGKVVDFDRYRYRF